MICRNCGLETDDNYNICLKCGQPVDDKFDLDGFSIDKTKIIEEKNKIKPNDVEIEKEVFEEEIKDQKVEKKKLIFSAIPIFIALATIFREKVFFIVLLILFLYLRNKMHR